MSVSREAANRIFAIDSQGDHQLRLRDNASRLGHSQIESSGSPTFASVSFANPTQNLIINASSGNDSVTIEPLDSSFDAALLVDGQSGDDTIDASMSDVAVVIHGGQGNDSIIGSDFGDQLNGQSGDDTINGGAGFDTLRGHDGNDSLLGGSFDDTLDAGSGNDTLDGGSGQDLLFGGSGDDSLRGGTRDDTMEGESGNDTLDGGEGNDELFGGSENDSLIGASGNDLLDAGDGNDTLSGDSGSDTIFGGAGDDSASGGTGNDTLEGEQGKDTLDGGDEADLVLGGTEDDSLLGGSGRDTVIGHAGDDVISGGEGNDSLSGLSGDDSIIGDAGDDSIQGGDGEDSLVGAAGDDEVDGQNDDDTVLGGLGTDVLRGGEGNDYLESEEGDDTFHGGPGNDSIFGGADNDVLFGDAGDDLLNGEDGVDSIVGGAGSDTINGGAETDIIDSGDEDVLIDALAQIELRIVTTATGSDVVDVLPDNVDFLDEWDTYFAEIWVRQTTQEQAAIGSVLVDLPFDPVKFNFTAIGFGSAFDNPQPGTLDTVNGRIVDVGGSTSLPNVVKDHFALVARVTFDPRSDFELPNDRIGDYILPTFDDAITIANIAIELNDASSADSNPQLVLQNEIWPVMYDLDDSGSVNFGDLAFFADQFGKSLAHSDSDVAYRMDFDRSGGIGFGDLSFFADAFGRRRETTGTQAYHPNFPADWRGQALTAEMVGLVSPDANQRNAEPSVLSIAQLSSTALAAISRLSPTIEPAEFEQLASVTFEIVDLPNDTLARTTLHTIQVDVDAANVGWFIDKTSSSDSEFALGNSPTKLIAGSSSRAWGSYDLLSVLMHEFGHVLGHRHQAEPNHLMHDTLAPGTRHLPSSGISDSTDEIYSSEHDQFDAIFVDWSEMNLI